MNDDWQAGEDIILNIAQQFSKYRVAEDDLYQLRDMLVAQALQSSTKKRPAAHDREFPPSSKIVAPEPIMIFDKEHEDGEEEDKVHDGEEISEEELAEEEVPQDEVQKKPAAAQRAPLVGRRSGSSLVGRRSGKMAAEAANNTVTEVSPARSIRARPKAKSTAWVEAFMGQGPGMSLDEELLDGLGLS